MNNNQDCVPTPCEPRAQEKRAIHGRRLQLVHDKLIFQFQSHARASWLWNFRSNKLLVINGFCTQLPELGVLVYKLCANGMSHANIMCV